MRNSEEMSNLNKFFFVKSLKMRNHHDVTDEKESLSRSSPSPQGFLHLIAALRCTTPSSSQSQSRAGLRSRFSITSTQNSSKKFFEEENKVLVNFSSSSDARLIPPHLLSLALSFDTRPWDVVEMRKSKISRSFRIWDEGKGRIKKQERMRIEKIFMILMARSSPLSHSLHLG